MENQTCRHNVMNLPNLFEFRIVTIQNYSDRLEIGIIGQNQEKN